MPTHMPVHTLAFDGTPTYIANSDSAKKPQKSMLARTSPSLFNMAPNEPLVLPRASRGKKPPREPIMPNRPCHGATRPTLESC